MGIRKGIRMKKLTYIILVCLATSLLAGCGANSKESSGNNTGNTETVAETTTENSNENETEDSTEEESTEESTEEETTEMEIVDALPLGPSDANFSKDNMGFYMEGEAFTLPMAYSEFLDKVTAMGYSIAEDYCRDVELADFTLYEIAFERPVEGQDNTDKFYIQVINSTNPTQKVDLADPATQVVYIRISMLAGPNNAYDPDEGIWKVNFHAEFYLTPEIGLGRSMQNVYNAWGGSFSDNNGLWDCPENQRYGANGILTEGPFITMASETISDERFLYKAILEEYGKADRVITYIGLYNNPFVQ